MEFKVNSKELEKLLTKLIPGIPPRTPVNILENFLFDISDGVLTVYASDLEMALKSSINVICEGNKQIVVPAKLIYEIVRNLPDDTVNFTINDNGKLTLKTEKGKYNISYINGEDFPEIPTFPAPDTSEEDIHEIVMNGTDLKEALEKTVFAISKEEIRAAMMGVLFDIAKDGIRFVATDGHRLSKYHNKGYETDFVEQYIIPERAISIILKILDERDVKIFLSKTHVEFKLDEMELITRLIGKKYPDYNTVIPIENEFEMKVNTKELLQVIKRMILFSTTGTRRVKFSIESENVEISAEDLELGSSAVENIHCSYKGEPLSIGFNTGYVNDIINHITDQEEITFKFSSPSKAVIIQPVKAKENVDILMLLMPVRLNN
ncbi:MAG: DNA polymerase III subunit beta [Ignavibacteriales bacterium]|nr:DNA polymerase III subunit beta [Ignavibacteriales bacterium]